MNAAVEIKDLVKDFGSIRALDGLEFEIGAGEIYGLIGPNGAGKTTTLRIASTLILPTSGVVKIFDTDVVRAAAEARKLISYLPEEAGAYKNLSGTEYLRFMAKFSVTEPRDIENTVQNAANISGLGDRLRDRVKTYSKGMKRRLLVARALMMKPKLAILDEPTSGLDVVHAYHVRQMIKDYVDKQGVTVLLSSHNMLEVEYLCNRVALINEGSVIAEGRPDELKDRFGAENLERVFMEATRLE